MEAALKIAIKELARQEHLLQSPCPIHLQVYGGSAENSNKRVSKTSVTSITRESVLIHLQVYGGSAENSNKRVSKTRTRVTSITSGKVSLSIYKCMEAALKIAIKELARQEHVLHLSPTGKCPYPSTSVWRQR